jgi:inner membrane protease subunit 2
MPHPSAVLRYGRWVYYPLLGFAAVDFLHTSLFRIQKVNGPSMAPTLNPSFHETGDKEHTLVLHRPLATLRRGDVVTFTLPHDPSQEGIKRVVALPGDLVYRDLRRLGKQHIEEGKRSLELGMQPLPPVVRVPQGAVWLEGDNWRLTRDSNDFGPISQSLINGRVWGVVWPLDRFGALPRSGIEEGKQARMGLDVREGVKVTAPDSGTVVHKGQIVHISHVM